MNAALLERNQEITKKVAKIVTERLRVKKTLSWADVIRLTPHGQPTERHICQAAATLLEKTFLDLGDRTKALSKLVKDDPPEGVFDAPGTLQDFIRARLIKAGKPAYVTESKEAFIPVERMVSLALDLGSIPTYPVMGDPVTPWEEDIEKLYDRLEALNIHAVEVIPDRITRERLAEIVEKAVGRGVPGFYGTEHHQKTPMPLI